MRGGRKRESESERWRAVGVHKSEKQAGEWSVAGSVVVAAAVGRPPSRALARALVPQRRVGVAVVMMRGCGRGERGFSARPFAAAAAAARPCLPRTGLAGLPARQQRQQISAGESCETRRPDFTARLAGVIRFGFSGVEETSGRWERNGGRGRW